MTDIPEEPKSRHTKSIPLWLLFTILLTLAAGILCGIIVMNLLNEKDISLSTPSIISFVFTVALGAASIILATITIVLSRSAEDALVRRSDEGIRLQNEVFVRTSEVLSTIQASTGVTEKRLEDVIAGRTGIIAQEVFEKSFPKGVSDISTESEERLKISLAKSLREELIPILTSRPNETARRLTEMEVRQEKAKEKIELWNKFRISVIDELKKISDIKIISETKGNINADTMEKFWDAVLESKGRRMSLEIHISEQLSSPMFDNKDQRIQYVNIIKKRCLQDKIIKCFIIWDNDVSKDPVIKEIITLLHQGTKDIGFILLHGRPAQVAKAIFSEAS